MKRSVPVNVLNLPGLRVLDFKETDTDYHVKAEPTIVSKLCPHCGRFNETVVHAQKRVAVQEKVKVRKKPKFEEVGMARMYLMTHLVCEERAEYEVRVQTRQGNLGTDLSTLEALLDSGQF